MKTDEFRYLRRGHETFTVARPKGPFAHSTRRGTARFHLTQDARTSWAEGRPLRYLAVTKCGQVLARVNFTLAAPDGMELCDYCIFAEGARPTVYRFNDAYGQPLYIGCTSNLYMRIASHMVSRESAAWYPMAAGMTFVEYDDLPAALAAEEADIRRLLPPFNKQHTPWAYRSRSRVGAA